MLSSLIRPEQRFAACLRWREGFGHSTRTGIAAIPRDVERAFSRRRRTIKAAASAHGYVSPRGMELAALRTRRTKRDVGPNALFEVWHGEARSLGFELNRNAASAIDRQFTATPARLVAGPQFAGSARRTQRAKWSAH